MTNKLDQGGTEVLRYTYDAESRLSNRWSVAKGTTIYGYDPVGNLTNINYPASTDVQFTYDALNRVTTMVDPVGITAYAYAAGGQLWTEDGPWSSDTVTNTYNPIQEWGGINLYGFVGNRPVSLVDRFGESDQNRPPGTITGPGGPAHYPWPAAEPSINI